VVPAGLYINLGADAPLLKEDETSHTKGSVAPKQENLQKCAHFLRPLEVLQKCDPYL